MILKNILKQLDLTKEQRQQVKGIIEANKEGLKNATESVRSATIALNKAVSNGEGEADIRAAAAALGSAIANKAVLRATTIASIKRILTPEQLQQVKQLKGRQARPRPKVMTPNPGVGRPGPGPAGVGPRQGWGQGLGPRFGDSVELGPNGPRGQTPFGYGPGQPFAQGMNPVRMFDRIDINGDGLLTRDEFQAANILQQIFKRADADKDGVLTIEELNAFRNGNQGGPRAPRW
jgi:Spy/CpxP family protein refolding chaperone